MSDTQHLPESFIRSVREQLPTAEANAFLQAIAEGAPPVSIQLNYKKLPVRLNQDPVLWSEHAYYLDERPVFTSDPLFHAGAYYVQEASSMIIGEVFDQIRADHPVRILDLCAAPGGKSIQLLSRLREGDLLVANDVVNSRARILMENLVKWGSDQVMISNNDPQDFNRLTGFFDVLLIDAPCSGEGMFRKDANAINEWSAEHVDLCCGRQKRIIADAWNSLAEDGVLIYATCTFNKRENEEILNWLITSYQVVPIAVSIAVDGIISYECGLFSGFKMLPGLVRGEGFCFFVVRKKEGPARWEAKSGKKAAKKASGRPFREAVKGIRSLEQQQFYERDGSVFITSFYPLLDELSAKLKLIRSGILVGEIKQGKLIPSHELALNEILDREQWPWMSLDFHQSLNFLMKEPFELPLAERGFNLLCFNKLPLGWINHLGNRFNSLYPSGWRIQRDYRNEAPFTILDYMV